MQRNGMNRATALLQRVIGNFFSITLDRDSTVTIIE